MAVRSRKVKGAQEAEAAGQAAQAKSKGSLPVGVPCQGYLPHQATRDPASIVEISQVWPCSLWCYLWLYPRGSLPFLAVQSGRYSSQIVLPMEINQKTKTSLGIWETEAEAGGSGTRSHFNHPTSSRSAQAMQDCLRNKTSPPPHPQNQSS